MAKYEDIKKANETIRTTQIQGKDYAEVNQRIKAFRMVYPEGFIRTSLESNNEGVCMFEAQVGYYPENGGMLILGTGHAYEKENSSFINKTSYIENCETSAVGRALGMAGFGIDVSVASYEEVATAIANQDKPKGNYDRFEKTASPKQVEILAKHYTGENLEKLLNAHGITTLDDLSLDKASDLIGKLFREGK